MVVNQFEVKIIEDSHNGTSRLTTFQLKYPRFIHQEILTHRVFSRNSASSRAIPSRKLIEQVETNPAMPVEWGKNQPGMQASELLDSDMQRIANETWLKASKDAASRARELMAYGAHKQIVNRILEPYMFMHTIITATDFDNFFELRCHKDADPTIQTLAKMMQEIYVNRSGLMLYNDSDNAWEWHLPYVGKEERSLLSPNECAMLSAARCARVSYMNHDGSECDKQKDLELANKLLESKHLSPFEHQATPGDWGNNNFQKGWVQFRSKIEGKHGKET